MIKGLTKILLVLIILSGTLVYAGNNNQFKIYPDDDKKGLQQSDDYKLFQNYPNPFNPSTKISYNIKKEGFVSLRVYNLVGQVVGVLIDEKQSSGTYEVEFDASELTTGVYLYKLQINGFTSVKRMTVLK